MLTTYKKKLQCIVKTHSSVTVINFSKDSLMCDNLLSQQRIVSVLAPVLILSSFLNIACLAIIIKNGSNKSIYHIFVILIHFLAC